MPNTSFDAQRWQTIKAHLLKHAETLSYNAGMDGRHDDGGAGMLRHSINLFEQGLAGTIPSEWERIVAPLMDPEWATYQRLKEKFGKR